MQSFTCPQCGHKSTFEPWTAAACCPACGFTPPSRGLTANYVRWAQRHAYQPYLDELLSHWNGTHTPDPGFALETAEDAIKAAFYQQVMRILRPGGCVCTVTDSEDIIRRREILSGYFPETIEIDLARYPRIAQVQAWMAKAGLEDLDAVTVKEPYELTSARPFRDRACSSLHLIGEEAWLAGLARLERDLAHGPVQGVARYACAWGRKAGA
jgi:hypothetical protein